MSPHSWASIEQEEYLQAFFEKYMQCRAKRDYSTFWAPFYEQWFEKFPERAILFPDIPENVELSEEQKVSIGEAVEVRKDQLRNKLRNSWGGKRNARSVKDIDTKAITNLVAELVHAKDGRGRKPQKIEAYLNLYYDEKIRPAVEGVHDVTTVDALAAAATEGQNVTKLPAKLNTIMSKACEMFKAETAEVKARVEERWKEMVAEKVGGKEERKGAQKDKLYYIERLAPTLAHFLGGLHGLTGWTFTVLMGGPSPEAGGRIESSSFHMGLTEVGNTFDQAYPEFNAGIMRPYTEFLSCVVSAGTANTETEKAVQIAQPTAKPGELAGGLSAVDQHVTPHVDSNVNVTGLPCDLVNGTPATADTAWSAPLQLTSPSGPSAWHNTAPVDVEPPLVTPEVNQDCLPDNFCYDFGSQAAIDSLDRFLEKYSPDGTIRQALPAPPTSSTANSTVDSNVTQKQSNNVSVFSQIVASASAEVASLVPAITTTSVHQPNINTAHPPAMEPHARSLSQTLEHPPVVESAVRPQSNSSHPLSTEPQPSGLLSQTPATPVAKSAIPPQQNLNHPFAVEPPASGLLLLTLETHSVAILTISPQPNLNQSFAVEPPASGLLLRTLEIPSVAKLTVPPQPNLNHPLATDPPASGLSQTVETPPVAALTVQPQPNQNPPLAIEPQASSLPAQSVETPPAIESTTGKRVRQPSRRNKMADSIGSQPGNHKKRSAGGDVTKGARGKYVKGNLRLLEVVALLTPDLRKPKTK